MKQWWQQLQQREQRLVIAMAVFISIFILHQGIWQPLKNNIEKADKKLERTNELLAFVKENTAKVKRSGVQRPIATGSLSSVVNRAASQYQITLDRIQPQGDSVQVWIDDVAFNQLLSWLSSLSNDHGLNVSNIDISKSDINGAVKIRRLQISRG